MSKALDFLGLRLNPIKDLDIINAIAPFKNHSERAKNLLRKGILTETPIRVDTSHLTPDDIHKLRTELQKGTSAPLRDYQPEKPSPEQTKANLAGNFD